MVASQPNDRSLYCFYGRQAYYMESLRVQYRYLTERSIGAIVMPVREGNAVFIEPKLPTTKGPRDWFTGDVYIDSVHVRKPEPSRFACSCVHFTPGARSAWHSHAVGQTLLIMEGVALVGTRDGSVIVARAGQVVYTPPDEEHWHGAAPDSFMVHLAMHEGIMGGGGAIWHEHVSDECYQAAAAAIEASI